MKFSRGNSRVTQATVFCNKKPRAARKKSWMQLIKFEPQAQGSHLQGLSEVGSTW